MVLALLVCLTGCGVLPTSGAVRHVGQTRSPDGDVSARFMPPGPSRGDSVEEVVSGFLVAMTGNPVGIPVARRFLDTGSQETWRPSQAIIAYDSVKVAASSTVGKATVTLGGVRRFDARGGWLGGSETTTQQLTMRLSVEDAEWRVTDPPDALVVPSWYFSEHYRPLSLYFLDQTGRTLVPNRVFVPRGDDAPTALVRGLLGGPGAVLAPVTRTAIPRGTELELSVVVRDGVAEVTLSGPIASLPAPRLAQALAQFTTTLRQVPSIRRVRLLSRDAALTLPNGQRSVSVDYGARLSPRIDGSDDAVFGLRGRRLVAGGGEGSPVDGPFGSGALDLRSVAVGITADRAVGVGTDGRSVLTAPLGRQAAASPVRRIYTGTDVLRPATDMFDRTWLVDRRRGGARVLVVGTDGVRTVQVPGVTGQRVTAFLISRDGTRLVALVDGRRLTSNLLLRDRGGGVRRVLGARPVPGVPSELGRLVDLSWFGPSDVAVLGRPSAGISEVTFATVDGSPGDPDVVPPDTWRGEAVGLAGSYDPSLPLFLVVPDDRAGRRVLVLDGSSHRWRDSGLRPGLEAPTYVG
ncbi:lipoprotein LpqB [Marmoricola endophyticus]|uniref:Lipoprotein LpqB n=1 Tax=Marmoricola endophyticus TaxID=2040280 RepID=A0A917F9Z9_9ACTN|nr:lipoprotein LpqB [Marmoricola endophyticus]